MRTPQELRGKKGPFGLAELTLKVRQSQESTTDEGVHSGSITTQDQQPVLFEKQAAPPDKSVQYHGADNTLMEQPEGRQGQSTLDTSASNLGFGVDIISPAG